MKLIGATNKKSIILIIFLLLVLMLGGTFAYWQWVVSEEQETEIVLTVSSNYTCSVDGGEPINGDDILLMPTVCTDTDRAIKREIRVMPDIKKAGSKVNMALWLSVNELDEVLSSTEHFKYSLTKSGDSCDKEVIASGTFNGTSNDSKISLFNNKIYTQDTVDPYYLWIWLDKEEYNNDTMNKKIDISLGGKCSDSSNMQAEEPVLDKGMIPVKIANNGDVTTIAEDDLKWHDYEKKEWANVVLVTDASREKYIDTTGVKVEQNDILAHYVWIPRFKYKVRSVSCDSIRGEINEELYPECYGPPYYMSVTDKELLIDGFVDNYGAAMLLVGLGRDDIEQFFSDFLDYGYLELTPKLKILWEELDRDYMPTTVAHMLKYTSTFVGTNNTYKIDVEFESANSNRSSGDGVSSYKTHPAFWWDNDNDGTMDSSEILPGIWVGKFETTGDENSPTVLPNVNSLKSKDISTFFNAAKTISSIDNKYGVYNSKSNAHMAKNSELMAVTYLANSKYGVGGEVRINNYYKEGTLTGCGAAILKGSQYNQCGIRYGSSDTYPQSTTGNISGVFDTSGGLMEYVMGVYNRNISSSGFEKMPDRKYYDNYTVTNNSSCTLSLCGGHGLGQELVFDNCTGNSCLGIHNDKILISSKNYPWYVRGGSYAHHHYMVETEVPGKTDTYTLSYSDGAFVSATASGTADSKRGFRTVIINGYGE